MTSQEGPAGRSPIETLISCGTKLWLDSIDPDLVQSNFALGATGATSNPIIIADLLKTGRFDEEIARLFAEGLSDTDLAWQMTDMLVRRAQQVFRPVWQSTGGNDGYVSFEVDPLLEDPTVDMSHDARVAQYVALGKRWSTGHENRMIKVPATPAGLDALEELAAAGVTLNVTLIFSQRQYELARDAVWRGAQRRESLDGFKSVYSIFVSRVDVYTQQAVDHLSPAAQGMVGIVNAKRIWAANQAFWRRHPTPLQQEIIFASTGTKDPQVAPWKYVAAFAGSDIETNPPATNDAVQASGLSFVSRIEELPASEVLAEIDREVDYAKLEATLLEQGVKKFADPQKDLLRLIAEKRSQLA